MSICKICKINQANIHLTQDDGTTQITQAPDA